MEEALDLSSDRLLNNNNNNINITTPSETAIFAWYRKQNEVYNVTRLTAGLIMSVQQGQSLDPRKTLMERSIDAMPSNLNSL